MRNHHNWRNYQSLLPKLNPNLIMHTLPSYLSSYSISRSDSYFVICIILILRPLITIWVILGLLSVYPLLMVRIRVLPAWFPLLSFSVQFILIITILFILTGSIIRYLTLGSVGGNASSGSEVVGESIYVFRCDWLDVGDRIWLSVSPPSRGGFHLWVGVYCFVCRSRVHLIPGLVLLGWLVGYVGWPFWVDYTNHINIYYTQHFVTSVDSQL
jgi:hypothetical protein